jgi:hypothetical protein
MTFADDSPAPAAPLSGDASLFDVDLAAPAKTTNERVVDTQSGFLFVIKHIGERLSLTCKRRVGTPPTSAILLTPDESIKLSKVLSAAVSGLATAAPPVPSIPVARTQGAPRPVSRLLSMPVLAGATFIIVAAAGGMGYFAGGTLKAPVAETAAVKPSDVESFTRTFVSELLDFSPANYRTSQIRAMASMSHELMDKYWTETTFPLKEDVLKKLPPTAMIIIDRLQQTEMAPGDYLVHVYAQLVHNDATSSPVHLRLRIAREKNSGVLRVTQQEDVSQVDSNAAKSAQ